MPTKNNINQSSVDFVYENHELKAQDGGKELEIVMISSGKAEGSISYAPV